MNSITIRNLRTTDTDIIQFIKDRLVPYWKVPVEEIDNGYILPSFKGGFPYIFIALTENNEFAGKIFLSIEEEWLFDIHNQAWISALFVHEKWRNQGIGRKLVDIAEKTARENGCATLYLDTVDAEEYYLKIGGWRKIGTDMWHGEKTTIMMKEL